MHVLYVKNACQWKLGFKLKMFKCVSVFFGWEGTKQSRSFEMLVMVGLWGCQWLLGIVEMLNANGNWALNVNEYWTMG
jgi:hypothetical protein